ncbi:phosphoglycerate kinase [Candidatus Velamenicoccus archaeovorus]|uniref:Phosphoglycerate kinase n=1 Tax=Velamenicoccus archaeovorus TaxID=1930593 RepID=A0A410P4B6_VELA1|nr:phosphoglycerate kinase [Candidatus Velamenicoccus archaeovorus]QAT16962.1 phosphoglycerate kinase [Candidatus Velamenicoccus archaeovorus]
MNKMTVKDVDLKGKKIIMRVDFNVPQDKKTGAITDDTRIKAAIPTIDYILKNNPKKLILMTHLGRPDGQVKETLRLDPVAQRLQELIKTPVRKLNDCVGPEIAKAIDASPEKVILLENLRFHAEEEENDPAFAKQLASLADTYVNDAFGTAHRAHASTEGVAHDLPAVAGFLLDKEIEYLGKSLEQPDKPFAVILGGAKVSDKIGVIENLLTKAQVLVIGGGMAYTFLKAQGIAIGNSKLEKDKIDLAKETLQKAKKAGVKVILPVDHLVVDNIDTPTKIETTKDAAIPDGMIAVDIGPKSIALFCDTLKSAKTICWNGPLGIFENDKYAKGTKEVATFITTLKAKTIIGGGDTASAVAKFGLESKMTHISTGGGASLEFMEGKVLPGIAALKDKQ